MALLAAAAFGLAGNGAAGQTLRDTLLAAGPEYEAGWLHTTLLGRHHRDLWTTPMTVGVLDLARFGGGLTPIRPGGGFQTRSLRFLGGDGREYTFRSVNKDPSAVLDSLLRGTLVDALVQDGISAAHPVGALIAAGLLEAADVLHATPVLAVLPDDPALGAFREDFAGLLGLIEEHPDENGGGPNTFAGAHRIAGSEALLERVDESPDDVVDARAYLAARLMDVFLGDWDRHRDQWRWATFDTGKPRRWVPIPRDRDQAFSNFDGPAMDLVRMSVPQFVEFSGDYPSLVRLHWSARELDRRFLSGLGRSAWDSVAASLQGRLKDRILEHSLGRLPPEIREVEGAALTAALLQRRDGLGEAAADFYRLLARDVDVWATDAAEVVRVDRSGLGVMVLEIRAAGSATPYFVRRFVASETEEVRVHLAGGRDVVRVVGDDEAITLRVVTGRGADTVSVKKSWRGVTVYDQERTAVFTGAGTPHVDSRAYRPWVWREDDRDQPRDWGAAWMPLFWTSLSTDTGLFLGGGARWRAYGFRAAPYMTQLSVRAGYAPSEGKGAVDLTVRRNRSNSTLFIEGSVRGSALEVLHYYGPGNQAPGGDRETRRVDVTAWIGEGRLGATWGESMEIAAGIRAQRSEAGPNEGRYFDDVRDGLLGGTGTFDELSLFVVAEYGASAHAAEATWGRIEVSRSLPDLDADRAFGSAQGQFGVSLKAAPRAPVTVVVRGGAQRVWGAAPWNREAFLGGGSTLRGWAQDRFTGDAALNGGVDLLLRLGYPRLLVPVESGVFGFADAGRVFVDGRSPGGWHVGVGGGLWFKPMGQPNTLRVGAGRSAEGVRFYGSVGLPWR